MLLFDTLTVNYRLSLDLNLLSPIFTLHMCVRKPIKQDYSQIRKSSWGLEKGPSSGLLEFGYYGQAAVGLDDL